LFLLKGYILMVCGMFSLFYVGQFFAERPEIFGYERQQQPAGSQQAAAAAAQQQPQQQQQQ